MRYEVRTGDIIQQGTTPCFMGDALPARETNNDDDDQKDEKVNQITESSPLI